jgi:hypothetical protein
MKLLLLLLLPLLVHLPASGPAAVRVTFSPLTEAAYVAAKKAGVSTKPAVTFPLKKARGRIVIPTAKGPKVFQDRGVGTDDTEQVQFEYLGYLIGFKCHLLKVNYYETSEYLLIDGSGMQITLSGEPIFAPNMQHIVAICPGIEYGGGQPNIIELLGLQNGVLRKVWSLEPKTWEPYRISWATDKTLLLSKVMWTGKSPGNTYTYARLTVVSPAGSLPAQSHE